jgi:DNA invertase Pin-like site-specific DNA recombinase
MSLSSMVNGKPHPLFKMFSHIFLAMAEQEKELIKERTEMGKIAARQKGVQFGRKAGSNERNNDFLQKVKSKEILSYLKSGNLSIREISKLTEASTTTILKVKEKAAKLKLIPAIL